MGLYIKKKKANITHALAFIFVFPNFQSFIAKGFPYIVPFWTKRSEQNWLCCSVLLGLRMYHLHRVQLIEEQLAS